MEQRKTTEAFTTGWERIKRQIRSLRMRWMNPEVSRNDTMCSHQRINAIETSTTEDTPRRVRVLPGRFPGAEPYRPGFSLVRRRRRSCSGK